MANINNKFYRICRLGLISLFCGDSSALEVNDIDKRDFDKVMTWLHDIYMDACEYEDDISGKVDLC